MNPATVPKLAIIHSSLKMYFKRKYPIYCIGAVSWIRILHWGQVCLVCRCFTKHDLQTEEIFIL